MVGVVCDVDGGATTARAAMIKTQSSISRCSSRPALAFAGKNLLAGTGARQKGPDHINLQERAIHEEVLFPSTREFFRH